MGYGALFPQFASRADYYRAVKPRRIDQLRALLAAHRPRVVIAYGKGYWPEFQSLFEGARFAPEGQFATARVGHTLVVLTDHFTARSMNGALDALAAVVRDGMEALVGDARPNGV